MLVDSHCHLDFPQFVDDLDGVVARAAENDVKILQTICTKTTEFDKVLGVAKQFDNVYASVGVHPNNVAEQPPVTVAELLELADHPKVIGIGETGLDYHYEHAPRAEQEKSFRVHIEAARELDLPVIVHSRDADEDTVAILADEMQKGEFRGIIHCFSTGKLLAEEAIKMGMGVSISGIITFKNAVDLQNIVKDLPLESLLVETDAPYLAPVPKRGKTNEPAFTRYTAEYLASLQGVSYDEVAKKTTENFFRLFTKATL